MKRTRNEKGILFTAVSVLLAVIFLFVGCGEVSAPTPPEPTATYSIHTEIQKGYLNDNAMNIKVYADGTAEKSRPLPVTLDFTGIFDDIEKVELSKSFSFDTVTTYPVTDGKAEIYNLEIGTVYYYRTKLTDGSYGEIAAFATEDAAPRNLYVDGVTNVRDLGGRSVPEGRVRQGLLYRGGRLNQNHTDTPTPKITEEGIRTMKETLGIKTEVDLRRADNNEIGSLTASVLGEGVSYHNLPMTASNDMLTANYASIRAFFALLADERSYPLYFHCSIGTDRTGFTAFLMLSVLGVELIDIDRDYLFSNFGNIGGDRNVLNVSGFALFISLFPGETLQEKTVNYLLNMGVTAEEIAAFRKIMIDQ